MAEMLVEVDYIAKTPEELTIKKGEIIREVVKRSPDWYEGVNNNNKKGLFPNYCVSGTDGVVLRSRDAPRRQCKAVFSYSQDHEDELNLKVGDLIDVIGEEEEGWWRGVLHGKEGVFPSNFVQEVFPTRTGPLPGAELAALPDSKVPSPSLPPKPVKTVCEVKYAYKAQCEDELNLKEGDLIVLITKDGVDPGWWKGELNGKVGVFPDNFVAILPSPATEERRSEDVTLRIKPTQQPQPTPSEPPKSASQRSTIEVPSAKNPPVPAKKPTVPIKKSPSGSGGIFQGLRKKLEGIDGSKKDSVDGPAGSKNKYEIGKSKTKKEDENQNAFDQVERNSLLKDVRAGRAKPPVRRPPTNLNKEEVVDIFDNFADLSEQPDTAEKKPQVREWEKHKAPWLEEMKLNQAKRSSTSPGPDNKKSAYSELEDIKNPTEKETPIDMSKSMPSLSTKRLRSPIEPETVVQKPTKPILKPYVESVDSHLNLNCIPNNNHSLEEKKAPIESEGFSFKQYADLVRRVQELEELVEEQNRVIERQNQRHQVAIKELRFEMMAEIERRLVSEN